MSNNMASFMEDEATIANSSSDSSETVVVGAGKYGSLVVRAWLQQQRGMKLSRANPSGIDYSVNMSEGYPVVMPGTLVNVLWSLIGMMLVTFDVIAFSISVFNAPEPLESVGWNVGGGLYWIADIFVNFFTAVYVGGELRRTRNLKAIARQYSMTWLPFDLVLVFAQWFTILFEEAAESAGSAGSSFARLVRIARYSKLLRLMKVGGVQAKLMDVTNSLVLAAVLRGSFQVLVVVAWIHGSACVWYWLGHSNADGWVNQELSKTRRESLKRDAARYLANHRITSSLSTQLRKYFEWKEATDSSDVDGMGERELMNNLPVQLRRALLEESRSPLLLRNPVFHALRKLNEGLYGQICTDAFKESGRSPGESVFDFSKVCNYMFLIIRGTGRYLLYATILRALLRQGLEKRGLNTPSSEIFERFWHNRSVEVAHRECLCEASLWTPWQHKGDLKAETHVSMLTLDVKAFVDIVQSYPVVQTCMQSHAIVFLRALVVDEGSDIFSSRDVINALRA